MIRDAPSAAPARPPEQSAQSKPARPPGLPMPLIERRNRIAENLQRQSRCGLVRIAVPVLIAERGKQQGAVSPATRANASITPVMIPDLAVRNVTEIVLRHCGTPSPNAASRTACGTISNISSVVRATVGTIIMPAPRRRPTRKNVSGSAPPAHRPRCRLRSTERR